MADSIDFLKIENRIRATPLDLLKQGIERGQWEAVNAAYTMLTGIVLPIPKFNPQVNTIETDSGKEIVVSSVTMPTPFSAKTEEEIDLSLDMTNIPDEVEDNDEDDSDLEEEDEDDEEVEQNSVIRTRTAPVNVKGKRNKFVDDDMEAVEDKAFMPKPEVLKKLRKKVRPEHKLVKVRCRKCGDSFKVDPGTALGVFEAGDRKMKYVCNECSCVGGE